MREIVHIQVGEWGNRVGSRFIDIISDEHGLDQTGTYHGDSNLQLDMINTYFNESSYCKYSPRAVLVDLDSSVVDSIKSGNYGQLYNPDNFITGSHGTGGNWAKGYLTEGADIIDYALDSIRKEAEEWDLLHGFQFVNSLEGGTGSGMGSLILSHLKDEYPDKIILSFPIFSSQKASYNNTILSVHKLIENVNEVIVFDNKALLDIWSRSLKICSPTFKDLNHLISVWISGVTSCFRFPGKLNSDMRKIAVNLVPFPRLHFLMTSMAPLTSKDTQQYKGLCLPELTEQMLNPNNMMWAADPAHGKIFSAAAQFRWRMTNRGEIEQEMETFQNKNSHYFVDWIPNNVKSALWEVPHRGIKFSSTFIWNCTAVQEIFKRIESQFNENFRKRESLHWYTELGIDEMDFLESQSNINDLISEYQQYQDSTDDQPEEEIE